MGCRQMPKTSEHVCGLGMMCFFFFCLQRLRLRRLVIGFKQQDFHNTLSSMKVTHTHTLHAVPPSFRPSSSGLLRSISRLQFLSRGRGHGKGLFLLLLGFSWLLVFPLSFFSLPTFFHIISNIFSLTHLFIKMCDFYSSSIGHPAARLGLISVNLQAFAHVMVIRSHILEE